MPLSAALADRQQRRYLGAMSLARSSLRFSLILAFAAAPLLTQGGASAAGGQAVMQHAESATEKRVQPSIRSSSAANTAAAPANAARSDNDLLPSAIGSKEPGWLYKGSDITPDPDWSFGTLPNGVRYAIRKNGVPPGQVAVRVRIDAGSLFEQDSEQGFAHLIEHLTFRGSVYVPDGEAKRVWQRMGTTFGSDTNAQTTETQTVYKLDLPGANEAKLDESLKILSGMMEKPNITAEALNAERPVVLAEGREQTGAQLRLTMAIRQTLFAGQPLANRLPIGTVPALEAATADTVRAFHDRWYRPERAVVIVSGDIDPVLAERLVRKNFAAWTRADPAAPQPDFGKPDATQPVAQAASEPSLPQVVTYGVLRPWVFHDDTVIFNQKRLVDIVALRVINRRLESRARSGGSFLQAGLALNDISRSVNATIVNVIPAADDWDTALKDVRAVIADAAVNAPTQGEIDREVAELDAAMKNDVDSAAAEAGAKEADDLVEALDIRETVASPQVAYDILRDAEKKGMFTPAAMLESTNRLFKGDATRAIVNLHAADAQAPEKLAAALKADVSGLAGKRAALANVDFSKLPSLGTPGKVVSNAPLGNFGSQQVVFSNGVRMILFPSASEAGRVYVRVRFGGGYRSLPANKPNLLWTGDLALVSSGIAGLGADELDALTTGRRIGMDFNTEDDAFTFSAQTTPADLKDQLLLVAEKLAHPSWDPNPVNRARAVTIAAYNGYAASPTGVLGRDLEGLLHSGDPRWKTPGLDQIKALTPKAFRSFWTPILASGPIEVDVFGDVKAEDAIDAVARSFGAMPARKGDGKAVPRPAFPRHDTTPVTLTHEGPEDQAMAVIAWPTGGGPEGSSDSRQLDVLAAIFSDRLFDRLRSDAGASYSPSVDSQWPVGAQSGGRIAAMGQVPPDKVDFFFKLSREIAADLATKPVEPDELKRTLLPMIEYIQRISTGNTFWLGQLSGAAYDPRRVAMLDALAKDLTSITPQTLQQVAAKYLRPDTDWTLEVVPAKKKGDAAAN